MSHVILPSSFLRTDAVYRTFGASGQRIGCGFWLAPPRSDESGVSNPYLACSLVLRGGALFTDHRRVRHRLRPGMAYLRLPERRHSLAYDAYYAECWLDLGVALAHVPVEMALATPERTVLEPGLDLSIVRRFDTLVRALREADIARVPMIAIDLLGLLSAIVDLDRRASRDRFADAIDAACRELARGSANLSGLQGIARAHGVGWERFRKVFAQRVGCSPGAFRVRCRLDRARELLLTSDRSVAEIAHDLGYASVTSFAAQFRTYVGAPPNRFRHGGGAEATL
jgi:AraC-like DNA-binding protein